MFPHLCQRLFAAKSEAVMRRGMSMMNFRWGRGCPPCLWGLYGSVGRQGASRCLWRVCGWAASQAAAHFAANCVVDGQLQPIQSSHHT